MKPETTELMAALILRQLSQAHRTAGKINAILGTHIPRADAARRWVGLVEDVKAEIAALAERIRIQVKLGDADMAALRGLLDEALGELTISAEDLELAALPPLPPEPRAVVASAESFASARAQTARLQSRWIELRERIVPFLERAGA